ncbi:MAG: undecaprenyldiphospho-muramoylpentapeptide beta-N-acetylglucosaminyltransferase [Verrucomicrobiota bacterium]|jgi:UDP-N-acetylglucosamine--N-acetylmuramyl-(pentapeptide) pyrophosphoryl-undecaprenol N-acetylglucosamine transferase
MTTPETNTPFVAIACGGTGGHLFPGLAVAEQLKQRGCDVALLISPKDIDQQAVKVASGMEILTLPAVGLQNRNYFSFAASFVKSLFTARKYFRKRRPDAVLAMGGFTSAPPVFVAKDLGVKTFLHESNTIPGRANRLLSRFVDEAFVGFPGAAARLKTRKVVTTGTPVRPQFRWGEATDEPAREDARPTRMARCRGALGLDPNLPTILVVGGSQGASGLNEMVLSALPLLAAKSWQWLHLTGAKDFEKVKAAYAAHGIKAVVKPFLAEMDLALGAATVAVSRAGASSLAEIAAMRLPALLVPFPAAADNHQFFNASAFEKNGAAKVLEQKNSTPEKVAAILTELVENEATRSKMQSALAQWHAPKAAEQIAENILSAIFRSADSLSACLSPHSESRTSRPRSDAAERRHLSAA